MLTVDRIKHLFQALDEELRKIGVVGEVGICGGAVMCLVFQARRATKDVDAIFEPTQEIRTAAKAVATRLGVPEDWLNDAAKAFFHADPPREDVLTLPNLRVWAPTAKYMLAMKCISARFDSHDLEDTKFLIEYLQLRTPNDVFDIIQAYYPQRLIPPKTQFLIEELLPRHTDATKGLTGAASDTTEQGSVAGPLSPILEYDSNKVKSGGEPESDEERRAEPPRG